MHDAAIAQLPLMVVQMVSGTVQQNIVCCITDYVPITMTSDLTLRRQVGPVTHINEHTHCNNTWAQCKGSEQKQKRNFRELNPSAGTVEFNMLSSYSHIYINITFGCSTVQDELKDAEQHRR